MEKKSTQFETVPLAEVLQKLAPPRAATVERIVQKQEPYAVRPVQERLNYQLDHQSAKVKAG